MREKVAMEKDKTIVFLHLPKTGGKTLTSIIKANYKPSDCYFIKGPTRDQCIEKFIDLSIDERRRISFIIGHIDFGIHEYIPGDFTYITFLREPISRVLSAYHYMLSSPNHPHHAEILKTKTLEGFLESSYFNRFIDNRQVRMLAGNSADEDSQKSNDILARAKYNLDKYFSGVGLTEKFDESLLLFQILFGWKYPLYMKVNVTTKRSRREPLTKQERNVIEKKNLLDLELYDYAKKKFAASWNEQGLDSQLSFFKTANRIYGQTYPVASRLNSFLAKIKR